MISRDVDVRNVRRLEDLPPVLDPLDVATVMRVSRKRVYELINGGFLRAVDVLGKMSGKHAWRIKREDLISYLHGDTEQGHSPQGR